MTKKYLILLACSIAMVVTFPHDNVESTSAFICTYRMRSNSIVCGDVVCEVSNENSYLSPGEYGIGGRYMDKYKNTAIDLHRKIGNTTFYGRGFWNNGYENPEDECKKFYHMDHSRGSGKSRISIRTNACFDQLQQFLYNYPYVDENVLACCSCERCKKGDVLFQKKSMKNVIVKVVYDSVR